MEQVNWLLIGSAAGFAVGGGLFALRWQLWPLARWLGLGALFLAVAAVLVGLFAAFHAMSRGSEGVTAGMAFLIFGAFGVVAATAGALILAGVQSRSLGRPLGQTLGTCLLDPLVLALAVSGFFGAIVNPMHRARADASLSEERARLRQIESLESSIPEPFRNMPLSLIDEQNEMRSKMDFKGVQPPPFVLPDIEKKMRELQALRSQTIRRVRANDYARIEALRRSGMGGLGLGWLAGAFALPLIFRPRNGEATPA